MVNMQIENFDIKVVSTLNNSTEVSQIMQSNEVILEPTKLLFLKNALQTTAI